MMHLPYPPVQITEQNQTYANLLSIDYCGAVSELSAVTQYLNHENYLSIKNCSLAETLLGIAMAEMMHLQKLGELIVLLNNKIDFIAKYRDRGQRMWTPEYLTLPERTDKIIAANIEAEKAAINQYRIHMKMINDNKINAILARIIKDEEYHIMLLQTLL